MHSYVHMYTTSSCWGSRRHLG